MLDFVGLVKQIREDGLINTAGALSKFTESFTLDRIATKIPLLSIVIFCVKKILISQ